ncbi:MAG: hypothetical protein JWM95_393 [Gemmatimonadetes bacterium]|nr:hypothetical protein [Gemmatimonadota bacterium]
MRLLLVAAALAIGAVVTGEPTSAAAVPPTLESEVRRVRPLIEATYRSIHEHPELGKQETATHALLLAAMQKIGYTQFVESTLAPTAVIAVLDTKRPGPVIALRAEMDARPDTEPASHSPRSLIAGRMHSCGHDAHAAMLLGAADILWNNQSSLTGKIVFVFQPAEETPGGADDILKEDILGRLGVRAIFAQHSVANMPVGTVSVSPGPTLAGSNTFKLVVEGKDSHAAQPSDGSDVPAALATLVRGLVDLPARRLDISNRPAIISVTYMHVGDTTALSKLQSTGTAWGTIRAFEDVAPTPRSDSSISTLIEQYLAGAAASLRVTTNWSLRKGSPVTRNDQDLFDRIAPPLRGSWPGRFDTAPYKGMFSEDFAYYTQSIPALYFGVGVMRDTLGTVGVHSSRFTVHPAALGEGARLMVLVAELATAGTTQLR